MSTFELIESLKELQALEEAPPIDSGLLGYDIRGGQAFPVFKGLEDAPSLALTEEEIRRSPLMVQLGVLEQQEGIKAFSDTKDRMGFIDTIVKGTSEFIDQTVAGFKAVNDTEIIKFDPNGFLIKDIAAARESASKQGDFLSVAAAQASLDIIRGGAAGADYFIRALAGIFNGIGEGLEFFGGDKKSFFAGVEFFAIQTGVSAPLVAPALKAAAAAQTIRAATNLTRQGTKVIKDIGMGFRVVIRDSKPMQKIKARQTRREVERLTKGEPLEKVSDPVLDELAVVKDKVVRQLTFDEKFNRWRETHTGCR